jgi:hypothetical protein
VKVPATILANAARLLLLALSGKPVLLLDEWAVYLGVCAASFVGAGLGSLAREHVPKQRLLVMLYLLLWLTVADFLKVINNPAAAPALVFYAATCLLLLLMAAAVAAPLQLAALVQRMRNIGGRGIGQQDGLSLLREGEEEGVGGGEQDGQ